MNPGQERKDSISIYKKKMNIEAGEDQNERTSFAT
jgi:hypothetical protein